MATVDELHRRVGSSKSRSTATEQVLQGLGRTVGTWTMSTFVAVLRSSGSHVAGSVAAAVIQGLVAAR